MRCDVHLCVAPGTPPALLKKLRTAAERCCAVQQTLRAPPPVATHFLWAEGADETAPGPVPPAA